MKTAAQILETFDNIRRAQRAGVYAPHKPLLILLALARVQRDEPRLVEFAAIDGSLRPAIEKELETGTVLQETQINTDRIMAMKGTPEQREADLLVRR